MTSVHLKKKTFCDHTNFSSTWHTKHYSSYIWGLLKDWRSLADDRLITQWARDTLGTPPLYNPKCQHCLLYQRRAVTFARSYESGHNARKSPRPRKRREAPLNRRCLGVVPAERERDERHGSDKQQQRSLKADSVDSALRRGLDEWKVR